MKMEKENNNRLIIFCSTQGLCKIVGNSALFYTYEIAKRIGRKQVNLRIDDDFYAKSETGVVSVRLDENMKERLKSLSILYDTEESTDQIHIFNLPWKYSDAEIGRLKNLSKDLKEKINAVVTPKSPIPVLNFKLEELNQIIYFQMAKFQPLARETIGKLAFEKSNSMLLEYIKMSNGAQKESEAFLQIYQGAQFIKYQLKNIENLRLIDRQNICKIAEKLIEIERIVAKQYKLALKKEQKCKN